MAALILNWARRWRKPIYLPADDDIPLSESSSRVAFTLLRCTKPAHWCVAGPERRLLEDFVLVWARWSHWVGSSWVWKVNSPHKRIDGSLRRARGFPFNVSCDNLHGDFWARSFWPLWIKYTKSWVSRVGLPPRVKMLSEHCAATMWENLYVLANLLWNRILWLSNLKKNYLESNWCSHWKRIRWWTVCWVVTYVVIFLFHLASCEEDGIESMAS